MALAESVYRLTAVFPIDERFGMTAQLRRAAVSVVSCIAEGNARHSTRDYMRFLSMSSGSLAELETQALLARRLGFLSEQGAKDCLRDTHAVVRQAQALRNALSRKLAMPVSSPFPVPRSPS